MKLLFFIAIVLTTFTGKQTSPSSTELRCVLKCDKYVYKIGELPKLSIKIYNDNKNAIYLIGALDGSDIKWRYPYCYYTIKKPKSEKIKLERCGNMNSLRLEDFKLIKAGQDFNPYENIDEHGFFEDYTTSKKETFKNPGTYTIKFHYSPNTQDINQFMGDRPFGRSYADSLKIDSLFKAVPRVELTSNEIIIRIIK